MGVPSETRARTLGRILTWRAGGILSLGVFTWIFTVVWEPGKVLGPFYGALAFAAVYNVYRLLSQYFHDRAWAIWGGRLESKLVRLGGQGVENPQPSPGGRDV